MLFRSYFDTGASGSVIGQKLAKELNLKSLGEVRVKSGGDRADKKPIPAQLVRIDLLEIGAAKIAPVTIAAMDRLGLGGDDAPAGVLSPVIFAGYLVTFDYPKKEIRIKAGALDSPDDKSIFAYQIGRSIPSVMAKIGDQSIEAHIDSGAGAGLSLPMELDEKLPLEGKPVDTGKKAKSVSGEFPVFEGKLKGNLAFGQFTFRNPTISFSDVVQRGNIGAGILKDFVLTVDVKGRRFQMVKTK